MDVARIKLIAGSPHSTPPVRLRCVAPRLPEATSILNDWQDRRSVGDLAVAPWIS